MDHGDLETMHYLMNMFRCNLPIWDEDGENYNLAGDRTEKAIISWLQQTIQQSPKKQNLRAESYRKLGNEQYAKSCFKESIRLYTKGLQFATYNGIEYGKALANRSAATFALHEYENCLNDIIACLASSYPQVLRNKLLLRRLQVFYHLNKDEEFYLEAENLWEKFNKNDVFIKYVTSFKGNMVLPMYPKVTNHTILSMNKTLASATDLVELKYNTLRGRHVVAAKDLKPGDILFQEKAFVTLLPFISEDELSAETCYHCLKNISYFSLPCRSCTYCLYCSEACITFSWIQGHRFECAGMRVFYDLGGALPAFRIFMKGIPSLFNCDIDFKSDEFGGRVDNFPWATAISINKEKEMVTYNVVGKILSVYLKNYTFFYEYMQQFSKKFDDAFFEHVIVINMLSLSFRLIAIESDTDNPQGKQRIGFGFYPSINLMNQSFETNVEFEFEGRVALVKAKRNIRKGDELLHHNKLTCLAEMQTMEKISMEKLFFD